MSRLNHSIKIPGLNPTVLLWKGQPLRWIAIYRTDRSNIIQIKARFAARMELQPPPRLTTSRNIQMAKFHLSSSLRIRDQKTEKG